MKRLVAGVGGPSLALALVLAARVQPFEAVEFGFVHDPSKVARKYLPESVAGGVALLDYDGDGLLDVYFVNGAGVKDPMPKGARADKSAAKYWNRLYRNLGGGKFEDVTERAGVKGSFYGMGAAAADFDNDGDVDLYVTGFGGNELFRNRGDGTFEEIGEAAGVRGGGWSTGAAWVDVDGDGKLDLAVARYAKWDYEPDVWCGPKQTELRSYCNPEQFPAETHLLFRNLGGGKFADVSGESGFGGAPGRGLGVAIADYDHDGKIDIAVANDAAPQQLFRGLGSGKFVEVGFDANIAYDDNGRVFSGMGIDWGDVDGDGRDELIVNALAQQRYALFRWAGAGGAFEYASAETGVAALSRNHSGWGMKFVDMDNDGRLDIVTAQGHVMDNIERTQPAVKYREPMALWRNVAAGPGAGSTAGARFVDASAEAGAAWMQGRAARGAAFGDIDNDGSMDVVVVAQGEKAVLFRNSGVAGKVGAHWLLVKLVGAASNRDGIGARVRVKAGGREQWRTVSTAGSYLASNDARAHFGLGEAAVVEEIEVAWPSGRRATVTGVKADQVLTLREPSAP